MGARKTVVINKYTVQGKGVQENGDGPAAQPRSAEPPKPAVMPRGAKQQQSPSASPPLTKIVAPKSGSAPLSAVSRPVSEKPKSLREIPVVSGHSPAVVGDDSAQAGYAQMEEDDYGLSDYPVSRISALEQLPQDNSKWLWIAIVVLCSLLTMVISRLWYEQKLNASLESIAKIRAEWTAKTLSPKPAGHKQQDDSGDGSRSEVGAPVDSGIAPTGAGGDKPPAKDAGMSSGGIMALLFENIVFSVAPDGKVLNLSFDLKNTVPMESNPYVFVLLRFVGEGNEPSYIGYPEKPQVAAGGVVANPTSGMKLQFSHMIKKRLQIPLPPKAGRLQGVVLMAVDAQGHSKQQIKEFSH